MFEGDPRFAALPTFLAVAAHPALRSVDLTRAIPCDPGKGVHAEHYIELLGGESVCPSGGEVETRAEVVDAQSKAKGAVVVVRGRVCAYVCAFVYVCV